MSYDLGNTENITYDGQEVDKLTLDGAVIWERLIATLKLKVVGSERLDDEVSSSLMHHEYNSSNWGSYAWKDGALINCYPEQKYWYPNGEFAVLKFDYFLFKLTDEDGNLISNWRSTSRFRVQRNYYSNPVIGGTQYSTYYLLYGYSAYYTEGALAHTGYYKWKPVTKGGKLLNHFIEDGGPENLSKGNSSIGDSGAIDGDIIWDTVKDIHANPSSYHIAKSVSDLTTDASVSTHPVNRITTKDTTFALNKYYFTISRGSDGNWDETPLDFTAPISFGTKSQPNSSTSTEQGGTWTYTVPSGVTQIEISGVGGGGGSWAAHDGGYGQNARPGGVGSGFKAIFNVATGDVFSGNIGNAGGAGYYNGGIGGPGSATTLKKDGTLVVTANAGGQATGSAFGANGTSVKASGWDTYAESIDLYTGTHGNKILSGGDGSCPACGYDPWGYTNSSSYTMYDIGTPALNGVENPKKYKLTVRGIKGGDTTFGAAHLSSAAEDLGYTMPHSEESLETDITISARPDGEDGFSYNTFQTKGGLAQVKGWIIVKEL